MVIVPESAAALKGFLGRTSLAGVARDMVLRMVLAFVGHRGRMSCSQATVSVASDNVHRGELTRFLARPRWQKQNTNSQLRTILLAKERRAWWAAQRLHGLCAAFRQECEGKELQYLALRLKTPGGIAKLQRQLQAATPPEFRIAG
jgi:hypothetical protein